MLTPRAWCWPGCPGPAWDHPAACTPGGHAPAPRPRASSSSRKSKSRAMIPAVKPHRMTSRPGPIRKPGTEPAAGVAHGDPVGGVEQLADRHVVDLVDLVGARDAHLAPLPPPAEDRGDREVARRQPQLGQLAEDLDGRGVEGDLLLGLAQRGLDRGLPRVDGAAGEGHLAGVRAHVVGALGQQDLALAVGIGVGEEHQDRPAAGVVALGRHEAGQLVDGDLGARVDDRAQPAGEVVASDHRVHTSSQGHPEVLARPGPRSRPRSRPRRP